MKSHKRGAQVREESRGRRSWEKQFDDIKKKYQNYAQTENLNNEDIIEEVDEEDGKERKDKAV